MRRGTGTLPGGMPEHSRSDPVWLLALSLIADRGAAMPAVNGSLSGGGRRSGTQAARSLCGRPTGPQFRNSGLRLPMLAIIASWMSSPSSMAAFQVAM